jgi:hypothetical protein
LPAFPQATFEHIADPQLAPDLLHVDRAVLVGEGGVAGYTNSQG